MKSAFVKSEKLLRDELAQVFERQGRSPLLGQIAGLLLFNDKPLSLQRIAESLKISRAAASINLRNLVQLGLVHKLPSGTDRRDYYAITESFAENLLTSSFSYITRIISIVDECIKNLPHPSVLDSGQAAKYKQTFQRLEDFRDVVDVYQHSMKSLSERIKARQQARKRRRI
jgi:DNA-binding transcriptional regulator GbsR (MarR family)